MMESVTAGNKDNVTWAFSSGGFNLTENLVKSTEYLFNNTSVTPTNITTTSNVTLDPKCVNFDIEKEYLGDGEFSGARQWNIIIRIYILSGIIFVGLVGNTLAFIVMWKDRAGREGNWMLRAIAVNDNIYLVAMWFRWCALEVYLQTAAFSNLRHWYPQGFQFIYYMAEVTLVTSHYTLVVATIERYIAICIPHKSLSLKKHTRRAVFVIPVVALLVKIPHIFRYKIIDIEVCGESYAGITLHWYLLEPFHWYHTLLYGIFHTVLPILILAFCNVNLLRAVRKSQSLQSSGHVTTDARITAMVITVVLAFLLCNLPIGIWWIVHTSMYKRGTLHHWLVWLIVYDLQVLNSSVNCFIYCFVGKRFRRGLVALFCGKEVLDKEDSMTSRTMSTDTNLSNIANKGSTRF